MYTCTYTYRYPWGLEKDMESYGDGVIGVCEPANVAIGIRTPILVTEQCTLPGWISPCQSPVLPNLTKVAS